MQELQNSKLRTQHSVIDNISVNDALPSSDQAERVEQLIQICQWFDKRVQNGSIGSVENAESINNTQNSYFMVKIDSLHHLPFRRVHKDSKVYLHLLGTLVNTKTGKQYQKYTRMIKVLEESKSPYLFDIKENICLYFYSSNQAELMLRIEVAISQEQEHQSQTPQEHGITIHLAPQCIGFIDILLQKEVKVKEKKRVVPPGESSFYEKVEHHSEIKGAYCEYYLVKSEAYKYLGKLINQNTLCDSTDKIPGIMGGLLPLNEHALTDFAITPEAQGLLLQISTLQISSLLLKDAHNNCQKYAKSVYRKASKFNFSSRELTLKAYFHNSWKIVSSSSTPLKEKEGDKLQTNKSLVSGLFQNKSKQNLSIIKQQEISFKRKPQMLSYSPQKNIELGLIFPDEQECVLILQIELKVTVTAEYPKEQNQVQSELLKEIVTIPVCFALLSAKGMTLHRFQTIKFYLGCGLNSFRHISDMIAKNMSLVEIGQKKTYQIAKSKKSMGVIEGDNISAIKSIKTMSNVTGVFAKKVEGEVGVIEFELILRDKDPLVVTTLDNISLMLDNISGMNLSRTDLKDKINAEKERILKETKKVIQKNKKMGIEFHPTVLISQNQKGEITLTASKQTFLQKTKQKEELLKYLRRFLPQLVQLQRDSSGYLSRPNLNLKQQPKQKKIYYNLRLSPTKQHTFQVLKLSPYFYLLNSNYKYNLNYSYFLYETPPIQIIRTELSEISYNNCFFFNFLNIVASVHENMFKFPQIFFFKTKFWNHQQIRSELMTINTDTGQIIVSNFQGYSEDEQKRISKIMHLEVSFDQKIDSYQSNFMNFVSYLYNGLLKIQMIDYSTGHPYGVFLLPLRNLIRKRRNQSIITHEDYIYHHNYIRGKMKVEVRCIRKMKHKIKQLPTIAPQSNIKQSMIDEKQQSILSKQQKQQNMGHQSRQQRLKKDENQRIGERIMKFKEGGSMIRKSSPRKLGQKKTFDLQEEIVEDRETKIENIFNDKFITERKVLQVCPLKKYFFFVTVHNKHDLPSSFRMSINDEDEDWINANPLSQGQEITVVRDVSLLQKEDRQKLGSIKSYQDKLDRCIRLSSDSTIEMDAKERRPLLLCYLSIRKYKNWENQPQKGQGSNEDELTIYNRQRVINCSFINSENGTVEGIYSIEIIPIPDESNIELQFYRPANERSTIHLPFIDPTYLEQGVDQIMVDDSFVLVSSAQNHNFNEKVLFSNGERGILLEITNEITDQECKQINVLLVNGVIEKEKLNQQRKIDKSRAKSRVELYEKYSYGPQTLNISLKIWGCQKFVAFVELWKQQETIFKLETRLFSHLMSTHCFYIFSQNQEILQIHKNQKFKSDTPELFKIIKNNEVIPLCTRITSAKVGQSCINVNIVEARTILEQQEGIVKKEFREVQPIYRMILILETKAPKLKEIIKININRSSQQKIMEEPFSYRSSCPKKTDFRVFSSDSNLVWAKHADSNFQLEPKAERKISIFFHIQNILDHSGISGTCDSALIGIKWDRGIDYFGLRFNIY